VSEADAGLQPERTRLAWQRTALTGIAALLVAVRLLVEVSPLLGLLLGVAAVVALVAPVWSAARWQLTRRSLSRPETDGRAPLLLAVLVGSAGAAALGYVLMG
jgi:uncharacterized membrane protein YidH (DUF202 family)